MPNVFQDQIINFRQYDIDSNDNIFSQILDIRKTGLHSNRFF